VGVAPRVGGGVRRPFVGAAWGEGCLRWAGRGGGGCCWGRVECGGEGKVTFWVPWVGRGGSGGRALECRGGGSGGEDSVGGG